MQGGSLALPNFNKTLTRVLYQVWRVALHLVFSCDTQSVPTGYHGKKKTTPGFTKREYLQEWNFPFLEPNEILHSARCCREHVAAMLFRGYSYNVPLQKYRQLRRNLSGDACHHSRITKFIKERRVVRSVQVRAFGPSNTGYSQLTTIMPSMDGFIGPVKTS
jgi:hypothetical protein